MYQGLVNQSSNIHKGSYKNQEHLTEKRKIYIKKEHNRVNLINEESVILYQLYDVTFMNHINILFVLESPTGLKKLDHSIFYVDLVKKYQKITIVSTLSSGKLNLNKTTKFKIVIIICLSIVMPAAAFDYIFNGSIDETFDDNVNSSSSDSESDWITNMAIGLGIRSEGRRFEFDFIGNVYQQINLKNSDNNANSQDLALSINSAFTENISLQLSDAFQHYPESRDFNTMFSRGDAGTAYISNVFSSQLSVDVTKQLFFDLQYNNRIMENSSSSLSDSVQHNPGIDAGYYINTSNIIRAGFMKFYMNYDNGGRQEQDRGYAEYELHFTDQTAAVLHGGYDYTDSTEGQSLDTRWRVSVTDNVDKKNRLSIVYLKENTISNIINDTFDNWSITGSLARDISLRINTGLSAFYGSGSYRVSGVKESLAGASLSLSYAVTEFISFNLGYTHTWNNSESGGDKTGYHRNQASAGLSALF